MYFLEIGFEVLLAALEKAVAGRCIDYQNFLTIFLEMYILFKYRINFIWYCWMLNVLLMSYIPCIFQTALNSLHDSRHKKKNYWPGVFNFSSCKGANSHKVPHYRVDCDISQPNLTIFNKIHRFINETVTSF